MAEQIKMTMEKTINLSFAVKIQMQALLETLDQFPKGKHDEKKRINDFLNWLERNQHDATFGFQRNESPQFNEAVEKITQFANEFKLIIET